jgi:hypothetical protein
MRASLVIPWALTAACSNAAVPRPDAAFVPVDAVPDAGLPDAPLSLRLLVVNEVAAGETPDWFEVVNATAGPLPLDQFGYVDVAGDFTMLKPFPPVTLPAGAYYTQDVDDTTSGFKLANDEELWVYRLSDHALSDGVDWADGASPMGSSYARRPDKLGPFVTGAPSKGLPNPP